MLRALILASCLGLIFSSVRASESPQPSVAKSAITASHPECDIEIINDSYLDVHVFGVFNDGTSLPPFNLYASSKPEYISLFYHGYCHSGMTVYIDTFTSRHVYSHFTRNNTLIRLVTSRREIKAEVYRRS